MPHRIKGVRELRQIRDSHMELIKEIKEVKTELKAINTNTTKEVVEV